MSWIMAAPTPRMQHRAGNGVPVVTEGANRTRRARFDVQEDPAKADPVPDSQFATGVAPHLARVRRPKLSLRYAPQGRASDH